MPGPIGIEFAGETFASLAEMGRRHGVSRARASQWIAAGYTEPPPKTTAVAREFGGMFFDSQKSIAAHYGVSRETVRKWLLAGRTEPPAWVESMGRAAS